MLNPNPTPRDREDLLKWLVVDFLSGRKTEEQIMFDHGKEKGWVNMYVEMYEDDPDVIAEIAKIKAERPERKILGVDLENSEKKDVRFQMLMGKSEFKVLQHCAEIEGVSIGGFIRRTLRIYIRQNLDKFQVTIK